jgi:uncharacterized repeat protein (TIGR01451 family)
VSPLGEGTEGFVFKSQTLTYTVRFENTGNYKADFVIITDELPEGLDISSLTISGASHPYTMAIYNNKLEVTMASIDLPSKAEDSIGCHGYVSFKVKMLSSISSGKVLENKANIYFDYNDPIITNKTINTVKMIASGYDMFLAPNPASDILTIGVLRNEYQYEKTNVIVDIYIQDLAGRKITSFSNVNDSSKTIDVSSLTSGIYMVKLIDSAGRTYTQKLQIK